MTTDTPQEFLDIYGEQADLLSKQLWDNSSTKQRMMSAGVPEWLIKIMRTEVEGRLSIVDTVPAPWVVFPDYVPKFSLILFKKNQNYNFKKLDKLQMRFFENYSAPKSAEFARFSTSKLEIKYLLESKNVFRLEDDNFLAFSFSSDILDSIVNVLKKG